EVRLDGEDVLFLVVGKPKFAPIGRQLALGRIFLLVPGNEQPRQHKDGAQSYELDRSRHVDTSYGEGRNVSTYWVMLIKNRFATRQDGEMDFSLFSGERRRKGERLCGTARYNFASFRILSC